MPGTGSRMLEKTLSHLSGTLEQAEQTHPTGVNVLDPRVKVIGALLITVAAVSARRWQVVAALFILLTALALLSNIHWKRLLAAWAGGFFFGALVAVPAIFTSGWQTALLLVSRSETSLTCWLLVVMSTPFNKVLRALRALQVPVICVAIFSMTFRYIFLLVETAQDMLLSRRSRIVNRMSAAANRKLLASTTAVLLGKSIQMSEDVYQAMTSRGFRGDVHLLEDFHMRTGDWAALGAIVAVSACVLAIGR